jgi:hypothetical protein
MPCGHNAVLWHIWCRPSKPVQPIWKKSSISGALYKYHQQTIALLAYKNWWQMTGAGYARQVDTITHRPQQPGDWENCSMKVPHSLSQLQM